MPVETVSNVQGQHPFCSPDGTKLREVIQPDHTVYFGSGAEYVLRDSVIDLRPMDVVHGADFDYTTHYEIDASQFDYAEERRGETAHDERRLHETILRLLPRSPERVLDVGCGAAWVAEALLPRGSTVYSMDISSTNPKQAVARFPSARHIGVIADAFHLPFAEGSLDAIVASEIIEHTVDPAGFIASLYRALRPGGTLIVSTPYKEVIRYVLCVHCNHKTPIYAHLHTFDEVALTKIAPPTAHVTWHTFGNKALLHLRTHVLLGRLPHALWKGIDAAANKLIDKRAHIVATYEKPRG